MLKRLALHLHEMKEEFYQVSWAMGATRADCLDRHRRRHWEPFCKRESPTQVARHSFALDGDFVPLGREGTFGGHHILVPKQGVAVHINAFNFPVWGMLEKLLSIGWQVCPPS